MVARRVPPCTRALFTDEARRIVRRRRRRFSRESGVMINYQLEFIIIIIFVALGPRGLSIHPIVTASRDISFMQTIFCTLRPFFLTLASQCQPFSFIL